MLLGKTGEITPRKNEEDGPKQKWCSGIDMSGGESKVQWCKEQYCKGTWNVRSMNQSKLDVVKQEIARGNINILEINELKWTWMGEFNSDDHHIYYRGQESLRRTAVALIVRKSPKYCKCLDTTSKMNQEWSWFISKANHLSLQ